MVTIATFKLEDDGLDTSKMLKHWPHILDLT